MPKPHWRAASIPARSGREHRFPTRRPEQPGPRQLPGPVLVRRLGMSDNVSCLPRETVADQLKVTPCQRFDPELLVRPPRAVLVGSRLVQGLGAAVMMPAALSLLTTSFSSGSDRPKALGVWGGMAGLASALGVFLGGVLTEGPGWRCVLEVNPPIAVLLLFGIVALIPADSPTDRTEGFDLAGAVLITGSMLTLVYALVKAPDHGWGDVRTMTELAASAVLLAAFVVVELGSRAPLVPLSIFRKPGLAAADVTQLVGVGGFVTMFFFLTLYMQNVLGFSPLQTGSAYLPLALCAGISSGIATGLIGRIGTRPVIFTGALITAGGLYMLSRIPVDGSYLGDLLPGLLVVAFGIGGVFVGTTTAANAGVPPTLAGLAAALVNSSQQIGGALGLAIFTAIATSRTNDLLAAGRPLPDAMTQGFHRALLAASLLAGGRRSGPAHPQHTRRARRGGTHRRATRTRDVLTQPRRHHVHTTDRDTWPSMVPTRHTRR